MNQETSISGQPHAKRAASEGGNDLPSPPAKRRATEPVIASATPQPAADDGGHGAQQVSQEGLRTKTNDELAAIIVQMQTGHSQQVAALSAKLEVLSQQLLDVKKCISTFFTAQTDAMDAAAHVCSQKSLKGKIRLTAEAVLRADLLVLPQFLLPRDGPKATPTRPPPSLAPAKPMVAAPRATAAVSTPSRSSSVNNPRQFSPGSPMAQPSLPVAAGQAAPTAPAALPPVRMVTPTPVAAQIDVVPGQQEPQGNAELIAESPSSQSGLAPKFSVIPNADGPPTAVYSTANSVREVWEEYRHGIDGQPSIESLDATWGPRWRPEPRGRTWYSRRKVIWDKIRELIHDGLSEEAAVSEVERLRAGRSMNWLMTVLQTNRKEVKASWKAAAAAATAAKEAAKSNVPTFVRYPDRAYI